MRFNTRLLPFVITAIIQMIGEATNNLSFIGFTKPLLMPTLALAWYYSASARQIAWKWPVMVALLFSTAGDILLMKQELFVFGLASFLVAHLFYIYTYRQISKGEAGFLNKYPWLLIAFTLYPVALVGWLWPDIPSAMRIPVAIYALVIAAMAAMALHLRGILSDSGARWLMMGAVLFVLSDSLIAVNKFGHPFPDARVAIMGTYIMGQYAIVRGLQG